MKCIFYLVISITLFSCFTKQKLMQSHMDQTHAIRLQPGQDLRVSIQKYVNQHEVKAGWIITCVGSLTAYHIRFANAVEGTKESGHFEIVSLSGTLSQNGSHMHISISDSTGKTIGGHLLEGCIVYTTAEIILQVSSKYIFSRQKDGSTPWEELQIRELKK
jgi:predicted DNA-binding protein with PD1-like motif